MQDPYSDWPQSDQRDLWRVYKIVGLFRHLLLAAGYLITWSLLLFFSVSRAGLRSNVIQSVGTHVVMYCTRQLTGVDWARPQWVHDDKILRINLKVATLNFATPGFCSTDFCNACTGTTIDVEWFLHSEDYLLQSRSNLDPKVSRIYVATSSSGGNVIPSWSRRCPPFLSIGRVPRQHFQIPSEPKNNGLEYPTHSGYTWRDIDPTHSDQKGIDLTEE